MTTKPVTNQEEFYRLVIESLSTPVTQFPLVDPSAQAINGGKTVFCEPKFTEQQQAVLREALKTKVVLQGWKQFD